MNEEKLPILIISLLLSLSAFGQKITIKGQVTDSAGTLSSATILILQQKDSSLINYGISKAQGFFEIKNIPPGDYLLKITFIGYAPYIKKISPRIENGSDLDLGKTQLIPKSNQLNEVVVQGIKDPVVIKRDTIEFNAASFKVKANANVEDLLKKLPGVEVDNNGAITAQGEQVQKVMVDGKEFFGQDPTLATRNLPADAVDKVQVFDKKSDQTVFSGIDDGQRQKTVNLELKEEKRHAAFGNDMVGVGSDAQGPGNGARYQSTGGLNYFNKGNQISFIGMSNNINQQGFSYGDYANFTGTTSGGGNNQNNTGQQNGIVTNYAGGVNTNQTLNNGKTKINTNYFYNRLEQNLTSIIHRINYLPNDTSKNNTYNFDQISGQHTTVDNHRSNVVIEHKIDSVNSVKFNVNVSYTTNNQLLNSIGKTMNIGNTALQNENQRTTTSNGNSTNMTSYLLLRHRFAKKGRTISANLAYNYSSNDTKGTLNSTTITNLGTVIIPALQRNFINTSSPTYTVTISYTEPLGNRKYLETNYNFSTDINKVDKEVFNEKSGVESVNNQLTNRYNSYYLYNKPSLNFRINRDHYNLTAGVGFQDTRLNGNLILKNVIIDRKFQMIQPAFHFNYDFTSFKRLRVDYTANMQEPTVQQLQPIIDNSDPLNLSVGNPQLSPAYAHQIRSNLTFFDPDHFFNFFALINANYTDNAITNSQSVDKNLVRTTQPVNVRNGKSISGNFNLGIPLKKLNSRFSIGPTYSESSSINLLNNTKNNVLQTVVGGTARYNYTLGDIVILDLSANLSSQQTKYSFSTQQNQYYFNKTYIAELNLTFLKNYSINTEMDYFIYNSTTTTFHQAIPLWKLSVSRYLLKARTGELKFAVNNILNYNLSVSQTSSSNYLQQQTTNNLGRYIMISFIYALNKQLNPNSGNDRRRGPGQRRQF